MLASRQPQAFTFLWIPLTLVTSRILLQTSNGDFPGSCNQNLPGDQIILESSLVPGTREEPGFPTHFPAALPGPWLGQAREVGLLKMLAETLMLLHLTF